MQSSVIGLLFCSATLSSAAAAPRYGEIPLNFAPSAGARTYVAQGEGYRWNIAPGEATLGATHANLKIQMQGANTAAMLTPEDRLPGVVHEYLGNDPRAWRTNVPTYAKVRARSIYSGIDLVYYGNQTKLEYDFIVSPGANPNLIRMKFVGASQVVRNSNGDLLLMLPGGALTQRRPILYQQIAGVRKEVAGDFQVGARGEVSFKIGGYDRKQALIIDPVLSYATYLGGSGDDEGRAIAVDSSGNAYVTGVLGNGPNGGSDGFVRKINPTGTQFLYSVTFGGSNNDAGNGVAVDQGGNAYVTGRTNSTNFPIAGNPFQNSNSGGVDAFLLRVGPNGDLLFSTYYGGTGDDVGFGVAVDPSGNAYITGDTNSADFPAKGGTFQTNNAGGLDGFVSKFDAQGNGFYGTLFGGGGDDRGLAIAVDSSGNAHVTGDTNSTDFPLTSNGFQVNSGGGSSDAFVLKFNANGTGLVYGTLLGGNDQDTGYGIAVDPGGNAYVTGATASTNFPIVNGAYRTSNAGGDADIFVTKIGADGRGLAYSTYIGSHGADFGNAIAVDAAGNAYVTGSSDSDQFPVTADAQQKTRRGGSDAVFLILNAMGSNLTYSTYFGGTDNDTGRGVALDAQGNAYISGIAGRSFPVTGQAAQSAYGGGNSDAFVAKYTGVGASGLPAINAGGIVNGASFTTGAVAPGSIISIFGSNFAVSPTSASTKPLPTSLAGVSVSINGTLAPLFFVGANQINAQVPYQVGPGSVSITVSTPGGTSTTNSFAISQSAPGIFMAGNNRAVVQNQDFTINSPSNPAKVGSTVVVYLTGIGTLDNAVATGAAAGSNPLSRGTLPVSATIGGQNAPVSFLGLTPDFVALGQANIVVPSLPTGDYPVFITVGGSQSNSAVISVSSF